MLIIQYFRFHVDSKSMKKIHNKRKFQYVRIIQMAAFEPIGTITVLHRPTTQHRSYSDFSVRRERIICPSVLQSEDLLFSSATLSPAISQHQTQ